MRKRGFHMDASDVSKLPTRGFDFLDVFLPPGASQGLDAYMEDKARLQGMDGTYIVDLEQWPKSKADAAGPYFPNSN